MISRWTLLYLEEKLIPGKTIKNPFFCKLLSDIYFSGTISKTKIQNDFFLQKYKYKYKNTKLMQFFPMIFQHRFKSGVYLVLFLLSEFLRYISFYWCKVTKCVVILFCSFISQYMYLCFCSVNFFCRFSIYELWCLKTVSLARLLSD